MKKAVVILILTLLLASFQNSSVHVSDVKGRTLQDAGFIESALPASPIVPEQWLEYWTNYSGGDGGNLLFEITSNTNSSWWEVEVWNQTTSTLNQTSYVKNVSGEGGHNHCYAVEDYTVYTAFGTSHPYQWDKWFDLEGVSVGSDIGPIESEEGESTTLIANKTETITTPAGTFECWLANVSQFEMGFWFYTNYWIDKDSNVTVKTTIEIPAFGELLIDELIAASWLTAPVISDISSEVQRFSATIAWITDEYSNSTVRYGTSTENLNMSSSLPTFVLDHSVDLSDLTPMTTYYFEVKSSDQWGSWSNNNNSGAFYSFITLSADAPEISLLSANSTSNSTAIISVDTDKLTNVTVWYGLGQPFTYAVSDSVFSTHHDIEITGLAEGIEYQYVVGISDSIGNTANSSLRSFTTLDQTAPHVEIFASHVILDTLNVTVQTNEDCYFELYVGENSTHLFLIDYRSLPGLFHSLIVTTLPSYSTVYFRVRLVDISGNFRWIQNGSEPFIRDVPDYLEPEVSHPDDVFLTVGDVFPSITWMVSDQTPVSYEIIINGVSQGVTTWDGTDVTLALSELSLDAGTHTIELVLQDIFGNTINDIVIVSITQPITQHLVSDENMLTYGLLIVVVIVIIIGIRRRR